MNSSIKEPSRVTQNGLGLELEALVYRGLTWVVPESSVPFGRGPAGCGWVGGHSQQPGAFLLVPILQETLASAERDPLFGSRFEN